jgi:hypothetical protein
MPDRGIGMPPVLIGVAERGAGLGPFRCVAAGTAAAEYRSSLWETQRRSVDAGAC